MREPDWDKAQGDPADDRVDVRCPECGGSGVFYCEGGPENGPHVTRECCRECDGEGVVKGYPDED